MGKAELHRVRLRADAVRLPAALLLAGGVPAAVEVDANVVDLGHSPLDGQVRGAPRHLLEVLRRREGLHRNAHRDALAATRAHRPEIHRTEPPPTALQQAFQVRPGDPRHQHRLSGRAEARQIWARLGARGAMLQQAHERSLKQAGRGIPRWALSTATSPCWGRVRRRTACPPRRSRWRRAGRVGRKGRGKGGGAFLKKARDDGSALRGAIKILGYLELHQTAALIEPFLSPRQSAVVRVEAITALRFALGPKPAARSLRALIKLLEEPDALVARAARHTLTVVPGVTPAQLFRLPHPEAELSQSPLHRL